MEAAALALIERDMAEVETLLMSVTYSQVDMVTDIGQHLVQAGGKRLRPALYLISAKGLQTDTGLDQAIVVAAAIELIHMATLVHDDVIDHASTRRGIPTANSRWGDHPSVLAGDYLFARAFALLAKTNDNRVMKELAEVVCSLCEGEILQANSAFLADQSEDDYAMRIAKKTADFLAASCQLGAMAAGMEAAAVQAVRQYGYLVGLAFQVTDDILDFTASAPQLGKPVGGDLAQGIITLPVIRALEVSPHREELRMAIVARDMSDPVLNRCLAIVRDCDAIEYSYSKVQAQLREAIAGLPASLAPEAQRALVAIADFVGLRKF
ncbi:polyprenyl synthetase family protein [Acetonema longum]|uniref:Trans-hexaprenyltranstransferase n=1 Tax=Acetonema longum DSM 6540 TaxID=1009370 RepID=F7NHL6_9FIRM|nr:polyprenyl synthetase family protein [Acetonema longum]EGO64391.1 trans-hexaprenyltranstransferase [Acetonema longum DSM 6540]